MVAADRQRPHPGRLDAPIERLDILYAVVEAEPRAHRHIADIGGLAFRLRHNAERVVVGADTLDLAHRAGSEAGAGPIGDPQVPPHPGQPDIEPPTHPQLRLLPPRRPY